MWQVDIKRVITDMGEEATTRAQKRDDVTWPLGGTREHRDKWIGSRDIKKSTPCSRVVVLQVWFQNSSISIRWELVRNTDLLVHPRPAELQSLDPSNRGFHKPSERFWLCSSVRSIRLSNRTERRNYKEAHMSKVGSCSGPGWWPLLCQSWIQSKQQQKSYQTVSTKTAKVLLKF